MEQEAAMGMLEQLRELRRLLIEYEREMQRLKKENERATVSVQMAKASSSRSLN